MVQSCVPGKNVKFFDFFLCSLSELGCRVTTILSISGRHICYRTGATRQGRWQRYQFSPSTVDIVIRRGTNWGLSIVATMIIMTKKLQMLQRRWQRCWLSVSSVGIVCQAWYKLRIEYCCHHDACDQNAANATTAMTTLPILCVHCWYCQAWYKLRIEYCYQHNNCNQNAASATVVITKLPIPCVHSQEKKRGLPC